MRRSSGSSGTSSFISMLRAKSRSIEPFGKSRIGRPARAPPLSGDSAVISTVLTALIAANAGRRSSDRGDAVPSIDRYHRTGQVRASRRSEQKHCAIEILGLS